MITKGLVFRWGLLYTFHSTICFTPEVKHNSFRYWLNLFDKKKVYQNFVFILKSDFQSLSTFEWSGDCIPYFVLSLNTMTDKFLQNVFNFFHIKRVYFTTKLWEKYNNWTTFQEYPLLFNSCFQSKTLMRHNVCQSFYETCVLQLFCALLCGQIYCMCSYCLKI